MKLGFDFDGVIADCGQLKTDGAKALYGVNIPPEKFKKEIVIGEGHLTAEQYRHLQEQIYSTRKLGLLMNVVDGVLDYVPRLQSEGHSVQIITSRGDKESVIAREWSQNHGLDLDIVGVGYGVSKSEAAYGLDLYVDDDLDKLEPLVGTVGKLCLYSWGYNKHVEERMIATRVESWDEIYQTVQEIGSLATPHMIE